MRLLQRSSPVRLAFALALLLFALPAPAQPGRDPAAEKRPAGDSLWAALPLDSSIVMRRGSGSRRIAVFSDPNCRFCRRFERDLATIDDLTVYILPYPVLGPDSERLSRAAWCAPERARAWRELMERRVEPPPAPAGCETPIASILALGQRLGARYTPTWILPSGEMHSGAARRDQLLPLLEAGQAQ